MTSLYSKLSYSKLGKCVSDNVGVGISKGILSGLGLVLLQTGCAYGPQTKDKSLLENLNGKHYETPMQVGIPATIPIVKRRRASVEVSGRVLLNQGTIPLPLMSQTIILQQDSKTMATIRSEDDGSFKFLGDFADGPAVIRIVSSKYSGENVIQIKGFSVEKIDLIVTEK